MNILITSIIDLKRSAPSRLHWFIQYLSKKHEITVFCINDWWKARFAGSEKYLDGIDIGQINEYYFTERKINPILQEMTSPWLSRQLIKDTKSPFDVHFNYNTLISGYSLTKRLRKQGIGTVYDLADDLPRMLGGSQQIPGPFRSLARLIGKKMLSRTEVISNIVTFNTSKLKDQYLVSNVKAEVLPNGVDINLFRPIANPTLRQSLGLEDSFVLGFVGTIREWIDFHPVFTAVRQLEASNPNIKMLIVGDEGGMKKTREIVTQYGIADIVIFTGAVPLLEVPAYTQCMDACVMPLNFDNCQPLTVLQYLACGKPVLSTRPLEIPGEFILYAPDANGYRTWISELMNKPKHSEELGKLGRTYIEKNHDWAKITTRLESILEYVAKKGCLADASTRN